MKNSVFIKIFSPPPFNVKEILRYSGTKEDTPQISALLKECLDEVKDKLSYKVCYVHFPLDLSGDKLDLTFTKTSSRALRKNLENCHSFVLFAATIGIEIDRLIKKYTRISPSKALMFQAIGTERVESLCNEFCLYIENEYGYTVPRFSAGYADLSLDIQEEIFNVLDPGRKIGVTLNQSMLMSPSKSVTAIVGITDCKKEIKEHSCKNCSKTNCSFRRLQ